MDNFYQLHFGLEYSPQNQCVLLHKFFFLPNTGWKVNTGDGKYVLTYTFISVLMMYSYNFQLLQYNQEQINYKETHILPDFIYFIYKYQRIFRFCFLQTLNYFARHCTNIGSPMSLNFGNICHASNTEPEILKQKVILAKHYALKKCIYNSY